MRWRQGRRSSNVEDRRGMGAGRRRLPGGGGLKIGGGAGIIVLLISLFLGVDLSGFLGSGSGGGALPQLSPSSQGQTRSNDEATDFVSTMLAYNEDVWTKLFRDAGQQYQPAKLVIFDGGVNSACGYTSSAAGPFYCPGDYQVYIDLNFFRELQKMGAGGDFAQAYVLAHEVGHHVQNLLGVSMAVQKRQRSVGKLESNRLSVLTELQADCYAGVWAHHAHKDNQLLEPGDLEEGMNAAARIGDDALMSRAGAKVRPEAFTHGSSKQRQEWLYVGLNTGDPNQCDTFGS
ncbi:KPN_02809 family neutral zinc metallopeptidase [Granulosicoccus sp. 3-233]|uniref:KPN_02809 family neutral zinc metallopeptidase n=1 Tax=Granulosicoccus sp. 3-233 TaxID=3417969 RepID=UPI003D355A5A